MTSEKIQGGEVNFPGRCLLTGRSACTLHWVRLAEVYVQNWHPAAPWSLVAASWHFCFPPCMPA